jgi:hypothetical protein
LERIEIHTKGEKVRTNLDGFLLTSSKSFKGALSCGENPLWIAKVMGHRNTEMIIKVYSKYIENAAGTEDGCRFDQVIKGTNEEQ